MKRPWTAPPLILILLTLLLVVVTFGSVGCHAGQSATSITTTTEPRFALVPAPQGTGNDASGYEWGYVDADGNWVIQPRFDTAYFFAEGLAPVKLEGKWGYIGAAGSIVIEPQFTEAYYFRGGIARVATGPVLPGQHMVTASDYGFIDRTGHMIIPAKWDAAGDFSEGLAAVMSGSTCGFIDTHGKLVIPLKFDFVGPFSEGLAQASVGGKCGYIDTKGNWRIKPRYVGVPSSAVLQYDTTFLLGGRFKSGLAPVYIEGGELSGGTCQYIDQTGKKAFPQVFQRGGEYSEGLAPVQVDDKWGFIDTSGRMVIEPQYDYPPRLADPAFYLFASHGFHDGLAPVALNHKLGYINNTGAFVVAPQYVYGSGFVGGFAYLFSETDSVEGLIDSTGRLVYRSSPTSGSPSPVTTVQAVVGSVLDVQAVVGSWTSEYVVGRMDLTLLADGTYQEQISGFTFGSLGPGPADHAGTWSIEDGTVTLKYCLQAVPDPGSESSRWTFQVTESWKLTADYDPSGSNSKAAALVSEEPMSGLRFERAGGS